MRTLRLILIGLVMVAAHGPGYGPFWDSGGGGEVVLFWDDMQGKAIRLISRWGEPGVAASEPVAKSTGPDRSDPKVARALPMNFLNPSSAALSPDHLDLWITEDSLNNVEGPPGNARVRRFKLNATRTEEIELDLSAWK